MLSDLATKITSTILEAWSWLLVESSLFTFSVAIFTISWCTWVIKKSKKGKSMLPSLLPPGPRGLPLVGHLPFIEPELHRYYAKLADKYGPIFKLQLGNKLFIVLNSANLAKEIFKDHGNAFADREAPVVVLALTYGSKGIVWAPYGAHWRMLRKLCVREILSKPSLDGLYSLRRREVRQTVQDVYTKINTPINVAELMFITMFNLITSMLWGGSLTREDMISLGLEFRRVTDEALAISSKPNLSDFFPVLAWFDIQGLERKMKKLSPWYDRILDSNIAQRMKMDQVEEVGTKSDNNENKDFLQVLLQLMDQGDSKTPLKITHIKALLLDFVFGATDTTSTTVEWAMAELMKNPETMRKAQEELEKVVGKNNMVEEFHLPKLCYLDAVIKETFRSHPVFPLLIPRRLSKSCIVGGYMIPKGARVMVNTWAIQRDPRDWDNPTKFQPERFLRGTNKHEYNGNDFHFLPFGSGRRICVGIPLVERTLPFVLATLLNSFDWELPEGMVDVDLSEKLKFTLRKKTPLMVIPKLRLSKPNLHY